MASKSATSLSASAKRPVASLDRRERFISKPPLLNGETILAEAQTILKFNNMSKRGSGVMGSLYVTNFKIAFMTTKVEHSPSVSQMMQSSCRALDDLLADEESGNECDYIPVTSISYVTAISTVKQVSKKLRPGKVPSKKYDIIEVACKDLRVIQFDFSLCREKERASVVNTIFVYAFPVNVQKLFAFDYARQTKNATKTNPKGRAFHTFRHEKDLELELARLRAQQSWRICRVNKDFVVCKTLPELNIVPASLDDEAVKSIAESYMDGRFPTLVWHSRESGASLLSSSAPRNQEEDSSGHSAKVIQAISEACFTPVDKDPITIDASLILPSMSELQTSYDQLFDACLCRSSKEFWSSDSNWLSKIDNSRWLEHVKTALTTASEIANSILMGHNSVIVHDPTGRDYTTLLVSLVQLMVDPYYRTVIGLESLIQKEWVTKGHPFGQRLALVKEATKGGKSWLFNKDEKDDDESPVFILFLDCIHQLWTQFPSRFGFTEQFLLLLIDSVYMCLFETFLFNSEFERKKFNTVALESVWDFIGNKVPSSKFKTLFHNQLYNIENSLTEDSKRRPVSYGTDYLHSEKATASTREFLTTSSSNAISKSPRRSRKSKKGQNASLSFNMQYQSSKDPNVSVINPDSSSVNIQLWQRYFLRWTPTVDLSKGSSSSLAQHLQQVELLGELKYLEDRLEHLRIKLEGMEKPKADPETSSTRSSTSSRKGLSYPKLAEDHLTELLSHFTFCKLIHTN